MLSVPATTKFNGNCFCYFMSRYIRMLEGRKNKKVGKFLNESHIDFSREPKMQKYIENVKNQVKEKIGFIPFSQIIQQTKIPKALPPYVELKAKHKRTFSKVMKEKIKKEINEIQNIEKKRLEEKIF